MSGHIKLSRRVFNHKFWTKARELSEFEAWLYLIKEARFDETELTKFIDGREITWGRGQLPASIRFLAKEWMWGPQKVRTFLDRLKKDGSIKTDSSQGMNVLTLCKYEEYNSSNYTKNTGINIAFNTPNELINSDLQGRTTRGQHSEQHADNTAITQILKKEKNIKNVKDNGAVAPVIKRTSDFKDSLVPFVSVYGKDMIRAFFDYWSEPNRSKTRMRFELEKTWDTSRRLKNWSNNQKNFSRKEISGQILRPDEVKKEKILKRFSGESR